MAWQKIKLTRQHNYDGLSFRKSGLYWNSSFIKNNRLEKHTDIVFHRDDENPYLLGFTFYHEQVAGSLSLQKSGRDNNTIGRTVKASALRKANNLIDAECRSESDPFPISYDKHNKIYFVELRPNFGNKIKFSDLNKLPSDLKGIYRYLDGSNSVIYIGKGFIRARAQQDDRENWGIKIIEYAVIESDSDALEWESHYIDEFRQNNGYLPSFNRIRGHSSDT
tara:strand:+ start:149 stop:814 length:666 start_codon:yes stop_codon:yes gene_type:complete